MSGEARRPRWRRPGWWVMGALAVAAGVLALRERSGGTAAPAPAPPSPGLRPSPAPSPTALGRLVPDSVRVRVEVLNGTTTRGLARRATFYLRDLGFDVVASGGTTPAVEQTLILDRTGGGEAERLRRAFPGARLEVRRDPSRAVDVTVLLGRDWTPPREPLYP